MSKRASVYLVKKIDIFAEAFRFFEYSYSPWVKDDEKHLLFLATIDFWNWELDNLIQSVVDFQNRAKAWKEKILLEQAMQENKIALNKIISEKLKTHKEWATKWHQEYEDTQVVAPVEELNFLIQGWNKFIDSLEKHLMRHSTDEEMVTDLSRFVKKELKEDKKHQVNFY